MILYFLKKLNMIHIKDKQNRTQIYIPRNGNVVTDYATQVELDEVKKELNDKINYNNNLINDNIEDINNTLSDVDSEILNIKAEYATTSYVNIAINNTISSINNELENILG